MPAALSCQARIALALAALAAIAEQARLLSRLCWPLSPLPWLDPGTPWGDDDPSTVDRLL